MKKMPAKTEAQAQVLDLQTITENQAATIQRLKKELAEALAAPDEIVKFQGEALAEAAETWRLKYVWQEDENAELKSQLAELREAIRWYIEADDFQFQKWTYLLNPITARWELYVTARKARSELKRLAGVE